MGVPTSEVGYTPAMSRREDHEVHKGHVMALGRGGNLNLKLMINAFSLFRHWYTGHTGEMASYTKYCSLYEINYRTNYAWLQGSLLARLHPRHLQETKGRVVGGVWDRSSRKKGAYKVKSRIGLCLILHSGDRSVSHTSVHLWGAYITTTQTVRRYAHNSSTQVKFNAGEFEKQKIRRAFQFRLKSHISLSGDCTPNNTKITESWSTCSSFKLYVIHLVIWRNQLSYTLNPLSRTPFEIPVSGSSDTSRASLCRIQNPRNSLGQSTQRQTILKLKLHYSTPVYNEF